MTSLAERFVEHGPGGALTISDDGRITLASPALHRLLGCPPKSLVGRSFESLMSPASRVYHSSQLFPLLKLQGSWDEVYLQLRSASGEDIDVMASAVHDATAPVPSSHCFVLPMGKRKQLESALIEARREAEAATVAKDQFLAVVSHELRSPLSAILGWAKVGQTDKIELPMLRQAFQTIERNALSQARLVDDLLDISRIVSGKMRLSPRALNLAPVIEAAIDTARPAAKARDISLISSIDHTPHVVYADPDRFQQIAWNLINNAIKFTPKGGRVQVTLVRVNSHLQFGVSDSGIGIAPEKLPFVFDRFWQGGSKGADASGLGLGLAICKSLVELHGGAIRAASLGAGQGTAFAVELPLAVSSTNLLPKPSESRADANEDPLAISLRGLKIVVVDDDPDTREVMKVLLDSAGAEVVTAGSFAEGIALLQRSLPDVVLSDIGLPGRDGYELIRAVRSGVIPGAQSLPAIAITGLSRSQDRVALLRAGFQAHLSKPIDPAELTALISAIAKRL